MGERLEKFILYYLPAFIVAGLIFYFSSVPSLRYEVGNVSLEVFLRKAAHFIEYALLSFFIFRIFFKAHKINLDLSVFFALLISIVYSASDELHQSFVVGRSGQFIDLIFDTFSMVFFLGIISVVKNFSWKKIIIIILSLMAIIFLEFWMIDKAKIYEEKIIIIDNQTEQFHENQEIENNKNEISEKSLIEAGDNQGEKENLEKEIIFPEEILINVPFASQAPFAKWDEYHEEACEEASLIMVKYYLEGKKLDKETAEEEIQKLITYQIKKYGDYRDSSARQLVEIARDYYGIRNMEVVYDFSLEDIKKYLSKGKPIIIPAAGRLLGNPNFTPPGPLYHNLVLIGYSGDIIITNDPGTRKGEGYKYDLKTIYSAIHDFPGNLKNIEKGQKAMIILK